MTDIDRLIAEVEWQDADGLAAAAPTLAAELKALRAAVRSHIASYYVMGGCSSAAIDKLAALVGWEGGSDA